MDGDMSIPAVDNGKRPSPPPDQPPLKRLKEDDDTLHDNEDKGSSRQACPHLKRSESHGISEYVCKAHNGFFGECSFCN